MIFPTLASAPPLSASCRRTRSCHSLRLIRASSTSALSTDLSRMGSGTVRPAARETPSANRDRPPPGRRRNPPVGPVKLTKSWSIYPQDIGLDPVVNPPYWASETAITLNLTIPSEEVHGLAHPLDTPMPIPDLTRFLREYPRSSLPRADEFFYWNMGEFGMKPTTRLNQVVIQPFPTGVASLPGLRYVIATRQIYANHYFSATLELRTLVDDDDGEDDGFFLLYATRSRVTGLSGFFKGLLRVIVKRRARSGMERYLTNTQAVIEGRFPGGH